MKMMKLLCILGLNMMVLACASSRIVYVYPDAVITDVANHPVGINLDFSKAMKEMDSTILIIANGASDAYFKTVITRANVFTFASYDPATNTFLAADSRAQTRKTRYPEGLFYYPGKNES
jgi:hypothetical protein